MAKNIKEVLDKLADGERDWIHDQLDGTPMAQGNLDGVNKSVDKALAEIKRIIEEAEKNTEISKDIIKASEYWDGFYTGISKYHAKLLKALGE